MNTPNLPTVLTPDEVAEYLKVSREEILNEFIEGRLKGFKVGSEWRCTDSSLLEYTRKNENILLDSQVDTRSPEYEETVFNRIGAFDYQWPNVKEKYDYGYETTREVNGHMRTFRIGFTTRSTSGWKDRPRVVVWIDNWPLVEFAGGNDYDQNGLLASIIKTENNKQLRQSGKIPAEYRDFRIARYNSIVRGSYASNNMAIIVSKDDMESMLRHAIIRAQWKGRI